MFKKFFTYPVFLVIVLSIIGSILFGALLRHQYLEVNNERFQSLKKFIDYVLKFDDVWICKRIDIAKHWIKNYPNT